MAITVLTPTERIIAGVKKGQTGIVNIPTLTTKQIQKLRTTPTITPSAPTKKITDTVKAPSQKSDTVTQTISTKTREADWLDIAGTFFPPAKLLTLGRMPVGTVTPTVEYTGTPEALASYADITGMGKGNAAPTQTDPLSTLSTGLGKIGEVIPVLLLITLAGAGLGLFSQFKGLFK